ncbi:hypothetical protein HPB50_024036 [Hyalomma asiaticum]|uniref:Uncharacterized protein n=1 Tax=Hyalomma asiaticum TaxID=266040 RepID=A0ACB7SZE7_HYAAI|nr:hypothetical protein HPB50_024036 [Hyalomma asiaticum]
MWVDFTIGANQRGGVRVLAATPQDEEEQAIPEALSTGRCDESRITLTLTCSRSRSSGDGVGLHLAMQRAPENAAKRVAACWLPVETRRHNRPASGLRPIVALGQSAGSGSAVSSLGGLPGFG